MAIEVKHTTQAVGTDAGNGEIAKAQWNESHQLNMATASLLGRSTAGAGAAEEIAIGSGLSLSAGTLSASGSGGGASALTIDNKTAAYTVVAGDLGKIINCTANTFTVSLTAAATLGSGFNCWVWNTGTGAITIDPSGTETVDGVDPTTEFKITQGTGVRLVCTGNGWLTGDIRTAGTSSIGVLGTQLGRNSAGNMAVATSGQGAMALGGSYASGSNSFAAAVANNTSTYGASGSGSISIGSQNKAESTSSVAIGNSCVSSGVASTAVGSGNIASGNYSLALGSKSNAIQTGKFSFTGGALLYIAGTAQTGQIVLLGSTVGAVATALVSNDSTAGTTNQVILPDDSTYAFRGQIVARNTGNDADSKVWEFKGAIRRGTAASTTALIGTPSIDLIASDGSAWSVALTADTTNGGLAVTVTGEAAKTIRWVCTVNTTEVTG